MDEKIYMLKVREQYPLWMKLHFTKLRIKQWYDFWEGQVYLSYSVGIDSTALLHLVRSMYPEVPAVIAVTPNFPEVWKHAKTIDNVIYVAPKMSFKKVIEKYGYPVVSKENAQKIYEIRTTKSDKLRQKRLNGDAKGYGKLPEKWKRLIDADFKISHKCCDKLKKDPLKKYEKETGRKPFIGMTRGEGALRRNIKQCNSFEGRPTSSPILFWNKDDVWEYIKSNNIPYCSIYDMGYDRQGCIYCAFGAHLEKGTNRFQKMELLHPKQWKHGMEDLGLKHVLETVGVEWGTRQSTMSFM